jgi:hypothetical protein
MPEATAEAIATFLYEDIYCVFGAPKELLSDNGANLNAKIVDAFLSRIKTQHRTTTPYHPQTNGKVERLNGMLGEQLTKAAIGERMLWWDEAVPAALFAVRARCHAVSGFSPYTLVFGMEPRLIGDQDDFDRVHQEDIFEKRLKTIQTARQQANKRLLERAVARGMVGTDSVSESSLTPGTLVIMRNEERHKFEATYFGPFRVLEQRPFGTYVLETMEGRVLKHLVNGARLLIFTVTTDSEEVRTIMSSAMNRQLREMNERLEKPDAQTLVELDKDAVVPTYSELSTYSKEEWELRKRHGVWKPNPLRDDALGEHLLANRRKRGRERRSQQARAEEEGSVARPDVANPANAVDPPLQLSNRPRTSIPEQEAPSTRHTSPVEPIHTEDFVATPPIREETQSEIRPPVQQASKTKNATVPTRRSVVSRDKKTALGQAQSNLPNEEGSTYRQRNMAGRSLRTNPAPKRQRD